MIASGTVRLRVADLRDCRALSKHLQDPDILRFSARIPQKTQDIEEFLAQEISNHRAHTGAPVHFVLDDMDNVIGEIEFFDMKDGCAEIGFWLARDYRGQGLMQDILRRMMEYAQKILQIQTVIARVAVDNANCLSLLDRFGFEKISENDGYFLLKIELFAPRFLNA